MAGYGGQLPEGMRRRLDASSVVALAVVLCLLPVTSAALVPLWWLVDRAPWVDPPPVWTVPLGYVPAGVLLFAKPVQRALLGVFFQVRRPTPDEEVALRPAWDAVLERAAVPSGRYLLSVSDQEGVNAYASGGHIVAVTPTAIYGLSPDELEGVLAHELSHHMGLHPVSVLVGYWLSLPIVAFARLGEGLSAVAGWVAAGASGGLRSVSVFSAAFLGYLVVSLVGGLVAAVLWLVALVPRVLLWVTAQFGRVIGRQSEYRADRGAVDLGFGTQLTAALSRFAAAQADGGRPSVAQRLFGTHPPIEKRISRIYDRMVSG